MKAEAYHLSLDIDFERLAFSGRLRLEGQLDAPRMRLDAVDLELLSARAGAAPLTITPIPSEQAVELDGVPAGATALEIEYRGKVSERGLVGPYRSVQPPDFMIATQFESVGARRMFPGLDRPDQKATFDVEVTIPADREAIFNTPVAESRVEGGRKHLRFQPTPRMATYLLFLGVGTFDVLRGEGDRARLAVWTPPGTSAQGAYVLDVASRVLAAFEEYYGVPYPLPKLDLVSVRDFAAGAMENWGAIASREQLLLADERTSSGLRRSIAMVTAHEIAHMWFGDLVTMRWWDDIWLNESFAAFMAHKILDRTGLVPDIWNDFLLSETAGALQGDSLSLTHPIRVAVERPEEIDQVFDEISYGKGASVLRMLEAFLGEEKFRRGVHDYLAQYQFSNARSEDLWSAFEAAAEQPVSDIMHRWVDRPGHPVVIVHRAAGGVHLEQRRFSLDGRHARQYWPVPLVGRADGRAVRLLLAGPDATLTVPEGADLFLNEGALGFYRVRYDPGTYDRLLARWDALSPPERWAVLEDLFAFLLSGDVDFALYRRFVDRAARDPDPLVARGVSGQLGRLLIALRDDPEFAEMYRTFFRLHADRLGLARRPGESELERSSREGILRGRLALDPEFAERLAARYPDLDRIDPDVRLPVAMAFARARGAAAVEPLWERLRRGNDAEATLMVRALGSLPDGALVAELFARAGRGEMPFQLVPFAAFEAARLPGNQETVWRWLVENEQRLGELLGGTSFLPIVYEFLIPCLGLDRPAAVRERFDQHLPAGAERAAKKGLEYLELYLRLRARRASATAPARGPAA